MRKETDDKSGGYLGAARPCGNLKRCGSEVLRLEQPLKSGKSGGAAAYRVPCRVGHVSDDNTDFFSADEKSGTGNAGFSAEPGE